MTADTATVKPPRARRLRTLTWLLFLAVFVAPVVTRAALFSISNQPRSFSETNWSSTGLLPPATTDLQARVLVFSARTGRWRGIFATHTWIVVKPEGGVYKRYEVVGFGASPIRINGLAPDARWFGNVPDVLADVRGPVAAAAVPKIEAAMTDYLYAKAGDYRLWPGPNSNTFVATVLRAVPELQVTLPPTAIGKDFRADLSVAGLTPSCTGFEFEIFGVLGIKVGWVEGIEINVLGLVAGFDLRRPALKIPAVGRIGIDNVAAAPAR